MNSVIELNDDSFLVKRELRYVEAYRDRTSWDNLEAAEISDIREHIAPLIRPADKDELARRFDYLIYSIDLGLLQSKNVKSPVNTIVRTAEDLIKKDNIPQVAAEKKTLERVQEPEFWDNVSIIELEQVRDAMRGLLQYLERSKQPLIYIDLEDEITLLGEGEPVHTADDLVNYRKKVEFFLKEHEDNISVYKLRHNKKLNPEDMKELERILWEELGSRDDYVKEYGETPVGRLVRKIVGLDRDAVNEAFSAFLSDEKLNVNQIRFINLIIDYIVKNGNIEDNTVLMEEPFRSLGSITTLFKDDMGVAKGLMNVVSEIRENSELMA